MPSRPTGIGNVLGQDEPVAGLVLPVVLDPRGSRAEPTLQPFEHLSGLDDVGVARVVAHRPQYSSRAARGVNAGWMRELL